VATVHDERHALTVANRQRKVANGTRQMGLDWDGFGFGFGLGI